MPDGPSDLRRDIDRLEAAQDRLEQRVDMLFVRKDVLDQVVGAIRGDLAEIKGRARTIFNAVVVQFVGVLGALALYFLIGGPR